VATAAARLRIFLQASKSVGRARPIYTRPAWPTHKGWTAGIVSAKKCATRPVASTSITEKEVAEAHCGRCTNGTRLEA